MVSRLPEPTAGAGAGAHRTPAARAPTRGLPRGAAGGGAGHSASRGPTRLCGHSASSLTATPGSARPSGAHLERPPGISAETPLSRLPTSYAVRHYNQTFIILYKEMGRDRKFFSCTHSFAVYSWRRTLESQETKWLELSPRTPYTYQGISNAAAAGQREQGDADGSSALPPAAPRARAQASRPSPRPPGPPALHRLACVPAAGSLLVHTRAGEQTRSRKPPCAQAGDPRTPPGAPAPTPAAGRVR